MSSKRKCHITGVTPKSSDDIEILAEKFLEGCQPSIFSTDEHFDVLAAIDPYLGKTHRYFLEVKEDDELPTHVLGITDFRKKKIVLPNRTFMGCLEEDPSCRFTAAHELGHVTTIANEIGTRIDKLQSGGELDPWELPRRRGEVPAYADPEWQANWFAAAVLLPRKRFWFALDNALHQIRESNINISPATMRRPVIRKVANQFHASFEATEIRWRQLVEKGFGPARFGPKQPKCPGFLKAFS